MNKHLVGAAIGGVAAVCTLVVLSCNSALGIDEFNADGCSEGSKQCKGNTPQTCDRKGLWQDEAACVAQTCDPGSAACIGVCVSGDTKHCANNTPQTCDAQGQWKDVANGACVDQTCVDGVCMGVCAAGGKRCLGFTPQTCDANGQWASAPLPCDPNDGKHCSGGVCVVTCTPGDYQCSGDQPQVCNPTGTWQKNMAINNGEACSQCFGCDPNTADCALSAKPDGVACTDPNKCTLTGKCQGGQCTASASVVCFAAGACGLATCDPNTGICGAGANGSACDDGDACTISSNCKDGICTSSPNSDHNWAHWDLKAPPPSPRYLFTVDIVYDNLTHLMWQRNVPSKGFNWDNAMAYCACLNGVNNDVNCDGDRIPGYSSGWRLPTRIELGSIVDYLVFTPAIDGAAFPKTPYDGFWSSSLAAINSLQAWSVIFEFGNVIAHDVGRNGQGRTPKLLSRARTPGRNVDEQIFREAHKLARRLIDIQVLVIQGGPSRPIGGLAVRAHEHVPLAGHRLLK